MRLARNILLVTTLIGGAAAAQAPDSAAPAGPTPAQQRYVDGVRTAARGVAQLKDGIDRVTRYRADSAQLRLAGQRLGGLCGSAGSFMRQGRAKMSHAAYADTLRTLARRLNQQVDSVIGFLPTCQRDAGNRPSATAAGLVTRLRAYEGALQKFREALVVPTSSPSPAPN